MTMSVALFDCPNCIDEFRFDYEKIAKLTYGSVGVPLDQMKPFDGTFDEDEPCWEVRL